MKKTLIALVCFCLIESINASQGAEKLELYVSASGTNNSVLMVFQIPRSECGKQPQWNPATQEPPLTIKRLCEIALTNAIASTSPDAKLWNVKEIQFMPFPASWSGDASNYPPDLIGRWFCLLQLTAYGDYTGDWWSHYRYSVVLLDGTVVNPIPRERNVVRSKKSSTDSIVWLFPVLIPVVLIGSAFCWLQFRRKVNANDAVPSN